MKKRIDILVAEKLGLSRNKAQSLIEEGLVKVGEKVVDKFSLLIDEKENLVILPHKEYVSRGAYKLLGAIEKFELDFQGLTVLDIGASTGGFTQVAIENGARKVFSVDVGRGELARSLIQDEHVVNMEGRDVRSLLKDEISDTQIVIGDLSFISLKHVLPKINELFGNIECILLFKPQFECGKEIAKKFKGVIKDKAIHERLLSELHEELKLYNWSLSGLAFSPIKGGSGNIEYLLHINGKDNNKIDIKSVVSEAFKNL